MDHGEGDRGHWTAKLRSWRRWDANFAFSLLMWSIVAFTLYTAATARAQSQSSAADTPGGQVQLSPQSLVSPVARDGAPMLDRSTRPAASAAQIASQKASPPGRDLAEPQRAELVLDPTLGPLIEDVRKLHSTGILEHGTTAVYVAEANTGKPIYAANEDSPLNPASNVKLISTATALDILGPDWRYQTRLLGPALAPDGTVPGSVYLLGSYDPTLSAEHFESVAQNLLAAGIRRIAGDIVVGIDPRRDSFGEPVVTIEVKGEQIGQAPTVTVSPASDFVEVAVTAETKGRRGRPELLVMGSLVEEPALMYRIEVAGTIARGRRAKYYRRVRPRHYYTARVLRTALQNAGIEVTGTVREQSLIAHVVGAFIRGYLPTELARHQSQPLRNLVARINKRSINPLADRVIMTAGALLLGGPPNMERGVAAMRQWLRERAGIDPDEVLLDTGSGLSYNTELTARQLVRIVRAASGFHSPSSPAQAAPKTPAAPAASMVVPAVVSEAAAAKAMLAAAQLSAPDRERDQTSASVHEVDKVFIDSLAVGGTDGTLRHRFRNSRLRGKILGKTGTLTGIIALSGIVGDRDDNALAFAIITNGSEHRRRGQVRKQHEQIVEVLYRYLRNRPDDSDDSR